MFVLVAIMGAGIPGPGDASLIAAGALAGEGKLNIWIVLATAGVAWMLGSVIGFVIGARGGRPLLDHPGRLEKRRRKLLAKGDRAFGRYTFAASATLPAFVRCSRESGSPRRRSSGWLSAWLPGKQVHGSGGGWLPPLPAA
jgi:membrane protein YqaA with SNARE-associated domain